MSNIAAHVCLARPTVKYFSRPVKYFAHPYSKAKRAAGMIGARRSLSRRTHEKLPMRKMVVVSQPQDRVIVEIKQFFRRIGPHVTVAKNHVPFSEMAFVNCRQNIYLTDRTPDSSHDRAALPRLGLVVIEAFLARKFRIPINGIWGRCECGRCREGSVTKGNHETGYEDRGLPGWRIDAPIIWSCASQTKKSIGVRIPHPPPVIAVSAPNVRKVPLLHAARIPKCQVSIAWAQVEQSG